MRIEHNPWRKIAVSRFLDLEAFTHEKQKATLLLGAVKPPIDISSLFLEIDKWPLLYEGQLKIKGNLASLERGWEISYTMNL